MKNWLSIGQFSKQVGLTARALRIYEQLGLIKAHTRGENRYRYYSPQQVELVQRLKQFKALGFSLHEVKALIEIDQQIDFIKLENLLKQRLVKIEKEQDGFENQKKKIKSILTSLKKNKTGLNPTERRFIMSQFEKLSVVVTGVRGLKETAGLIKDHLAADGKNIPVHIWNGRSALPAEKPYILVVSEENLQKKPISELAPDVVVIKELSRSSAKIKAAYAQLFNFAGPHMSTIMNADDRAVVELAASSFIKKGKTYYFSKNSGLQEQIQKIGGVMSDGEKIEIYGFNQCEGPVEITLPRILGIDEEVSLLASLAAIMDLGLHIDNVNNSIK